jgi:hypothetical protein
LLEASIDDLERLATLLPLFPPSNTFAEQIKRAFDKADDNPELKHYREKIRQWLVFNSRYYLGELLALVNAVKDDEKSGSVNNGDALAALAKVDWSTAEPLIQTLANSGQRRTSTLALTLLYRHSLEDKDAGAELKYRRQLQSIAANRIFPGRARDDAIEALSTTEWSGRDDWYLSIVADDSLIQVHDGSYGFSPLMTILYREPDKWIPVMTKLVEGKDRALQQGAGSCLVRYAISEPRRDVLLPVVRWLSDPDWIPIRSSERAWFIQKMDQVDLPESVPGLIWIVEHDKDDRRWAARTLARYKDPRAIPALKKALAESDEDARPLVLDGLLASGGLTEAEQVSALEAYAAKLTTESGREEVHRFRSYGDERLPIHLSIGKYLAHLRTPPDALVRAVITRAASLRKNNEVLSKLLLEITTQWQGRQVDLDLVKRIAANTADASTIIAALQRQSQLRESVQPELQSLLTASGMPQGIGAVLLEEKNIAASILSSNDEAAQIALLACARLTQTPLPVAGIEPLLKSNKSLLVTAAERYLLADDSKEARALLWQHHPNEAFVTGWLDAIGLIEGNFDQMHQLEEKLRAELLKSDGPTDIYAVLHNDRSDDRVLRIYADKAVYTYYEDSSRYRERVIPKGEIVEFKQFVSNDGLWDLGPQIGDCHYNCRATELLMLTREKGRRVFSDQDFSNLIAVRENFDRLGHGATTRYNLEKDIKGLEVLYEDETLKVKDVWQRGDEIRIFVVREETEEQNPAPSTPSSSWRKLKGNPLARDAGSTTTAPDGYSTFDETRFPRDENDDSEHDDRQVQMITPDAILIARNFDGLWKQVAGTKPVRISTGDDDTYANPIVTGDGKWAVLSKADGDWSKPNYVVRFNLETGREFRVNIEPADQFDPIVYLPLHGKTLLRREKDDYYGMSREPVGPDKPEYYLLDPQTGAVQTITGVFEPLLQEGKRFLQPTENPNEYWAAIPNATKDQTQVGRYNVKDFSFKSVLTVPQITFDSMSMWVDEKQGEIYLVYKDQLLRLPLRSTP